MGEIVFTHPPPTPYAELNGVLAELVSGMLEVLGKKLVGVYLQGSFAVGDFDEHSDVDFIVAIAADLTTEEVARLDEVHGRVYDLPCPWAQHLEGSYFPLDVLRSATTVGRPLWYLDHGARSLKQSTHCNTLVVRWIVRERAVTLFGPRPDLLVDPVSTDALRSEIYTVMHEWAAEIRAKPELYRNHFYQAFIVLSYCRMLHDFEAGSIGSKRTGAEWFKARARQWSGLIDRAWSGRPDPAASVRRAAEPNEFALTLQLMEHVLALTERPS
jgi:hypothetical protein